MWGAVLFGAVGCYALKLLGLSIPERILESERVRRMAALLPVALLASLIAIGTFSERGHLTFDERIAGLAVGALAIRVKAPFLVVVGSAAATSALLRLAL